MPLTAQLDRIESQLQELERLASSADTLSRRRDAVSAWSVGQHVEHLGIAHAILFESFAAFAEKDDPAQAHGGIRLIGRVVLWIGRIQRGKAKAPERTNPSSEPGAAERRLARSRAGFATLRSRGNLEAVRARLPHPYFGRLDVTQWMRFVEIHQDHHLRIIRDILAG
jgi:hypothetical protein